MPREDVPADEPRSGAEEIMDIREAYPLMDAVARQEGWDDPEMESYNVYARRGSP